MYQKLERKASTMPCLTNPIEILIPPFRKILSIRFLFLIICLSLPVLWLESSQQYIDVDEHVREALGNVANDFRYYEVYRLPNKRPKHLKYILLWTSYRWSPFDELNDGQRAFIESNCSMINCYVTTDRRFFSGDITKFDAVVFNGVPSIDFANLPSRRSIRQKYIYSNMESSDYYPVCAERYDNYFNWTITYRLDSDLPGMYIVIKNRNGEVVGPKRSMEWVDMNTTDIDEEWPHDYIQNKSKAAAWFVTNCWSRSGREQFVKKLQHALALYGLAVDVYGPCGPLHCPRSRKADCYSKLQKDYFFYLALENSFAEDYVTEKLLTAVRHNVVPIVFGGANYSRFLPPGSYLDGRRQTPKQLAATVAELINSKERYLQFFRWKSYYTYQLKKNRECDLCAALNNKSFMESKSVYKEFRRWWNPNYVNMNCSSSAETKIRRNNKLNTLLFNIILESLYLYEFNLS